MQWENNRSKSDSFPEYNTSKTSDDNKNIDKKNTFTVNKGLQEELKKIHKF